MNIKFYPESDKEQFIQAAAEYQKIWDKEGGSIMNAFQQIADLWLPETDINAVTYEGISHAYPLALRASYDIETKKGTLVHEIGHRVLVDNGIKGKGALESHKQLNVILFDVWTELYGNEFALSQVAVEKKRAPVYQEAWEWFEKMTPAERKESFEQLKKR